MITLEQIKAIASLMPEDKPRKAGRPPKNAVSFIDVPAWIAEYLGHITITETKVRNGTTLYVLSECPFDPSHKAPDSVIGQMPSGAVFFKCFHNSCQGYGWKELRERFCSKDVLSSETETVSHKDTREIIEALRESTGLPVIEIGGGQLRDAVDAVINALEDIRVENGPLLYVRGGSLARIVTDPDGRLRPSIVSSAAMPEIMSRAANFVRIGKNGCVEIFPPESLATAIVNRDYWPFPELRGIVEIPVLREDGSLLKTPGYDNVSGLYYHPAGPIPDIPEDATREDAMRAARFVLDILSDFPFQDDASRDNTIGLLLSVIVKEISGLVPIALIDAPTKGTGKTRLAQLASIIATGRETPLSPEVRDEEEWRKQITSLLLADRQIIVIDNIERTLRSGQLAAALTTSEWSDRLLGKSEALHLHSRAIWVATGNNLHLGGDIARRAYWIRLNSNLPRPWLRDSREFKRELPSWAVEHRHEIVGALLTMALAWFRNGKPEWVGRPLGSYETWSRTVGGILEYCGMTGFLSNLENLYDQTDDEPTQWAVFFEVVFNIFGENNPFSSKTLIERITGESVHSMCNSNTGGSLKSVLPESLGDINDRGFSRRLGLAMRKRRDQIFELAGGLVQLKEAFQDSHRQKPQWKLFIISNAPSAPFAPSSNGDTPDDGKIIPKKSRGGEEIIIFSSGERTAEKGALGALGANENDASIYESEEREAIRNEGKLCQDRD